jgi:phthiocerol/phenolphthiocerol synthesis type-I polyketide synthase E
MRHPLQSRDDRDAFLLGLGQLWSAGVDVDWTALQGDQVHRVTLPGYAFARQRHWIEPAAFVRSADASAPIGTVVAEPQPTDRKPERHGRPLADAGDATADLVAVSGVESIAPGDNFFELGGDSLLAIGVAMTASHEGVELTRRTSTTMAALARWPTPSSHATHPAGWQARTLRSESHRSRRTFIRFLDSGLAEPGRWRAPLVLRLESSVSVEDVRAVMTAVVNHHDALRMRVANRAGMWEQHISEPRDFADLAECSLPADALPGTQHEREAISAIVSDTIGAQDLDSWPLTATYVIDAQGDPRFLVLTVHEMVDDTTSREVLVTDLLTAFAQRLAGSDIVLWNRPPRAGGSGPLAEGAALAGPPRGARPDVTTGSTMPPKATLRLADAEIAGAPGSR